VKQAVVYLRRSTDRQEQSIDDQRAVITAYAKAHGFEIIREFCDDAVSGASAANREAFQEMIQSVEFAQGEIGAVLCYDISRFGRTDSDEAGFYRYRLKKAGCQVVYVAENLPNNRAGDLVRDVKQWQKREFLVDLSRDVVRGLLSAAQKGNSCGKPTPFGFDRIAKDGKATLTPGDPQKVEIVRDIFSLYLQGYGCLQIAHELNRRGLRGPTGRDWRQTTIGFILSNREYVGDMVYNKRSRGKFHGISAGRVVAKEFNSSSFRRNPQQDWIIVEAAHEAIIDRETFEKVQAVMRERAKNRNGAIGRSLNYSYKNNYLLSGLVRCGCGAKMHGLPTSSYKNGERIYHTRYVCSAGASGGNCDRNAVDSSLLDKFILDKVKEELGRDDNRETLLSMLKEELAERTKTASVPVGDIDRKIQEIDNSVNLILEGLSPENIALANSQLTELREERERLERQKAAVLGTHPLQMGVEKAAEKALALLPRLEECEKSGLFGELKELVGLFVSKITLTFEKVKIDGRFVRQLKEGFLEIGTLLGIASSEVTKVLTNTSNREML